MISSQHQEKRTSGVIFEVSASIYHLVMVVVKIRNSPDSQPINGFVLCNICKQVLRYDAKVTGSSHLNRHAQTCKRPQTKTIQLQLTSLFNKKIKPTDAKKQGIKESQLQYCVQGHHSFKSLENEGLHSLLQTMVNIAAKHGRFDVKDLLYGRKTISEFSKLKAEELKAKTENRTN